MEDFRACSEVCDAHGFARQAEFFRRFAGDRCPVYVVVERANELPEDEDLHEGGEPVAVLFDRAEAEAEADRRNLRAYRERNLIDICYEAGLFGYGDYDEDDAPLHHITELTADDLSDQIAAILGQPYRFPDRGPAPMPIFPTSVTDDQMRRIIELFSPRFFAVREAEIKV